MQLMKEFACQQIQFARQYMLDLLQDVADEEWFNIPLGNVSHIAWQVGHLAMAQYGLTLLRTRDRQAEDEQFIAKDFIRCFKKGSQPVADATKYPSPAEIRTVLAGVHARALQEIPTFSDELLNESLPAPTAVYPNKLGSILFCPAHEMLHAGQIGLLRRQLGKDPVR
jgi:hypothetical protein